MRRAAQTMKKKHIRTVVDMAMIVLLPMLMAYSLIGEKLHEIKRVRDYRTIVYRKKLKVFVDTNII